MLRLVFMLLQVEFKDEFSTKNAMTTQVIDYNLESFTSECKPKVDLMR